MSEKTTHPSPEELTAFGLGQLPPKEAAAIESHISECQPCCETMLGLSSDDTFVGLLQEAKQLPTGQLPTDATCDDDGSPAKPAMSAHDIPAPLAEHTRYEIVGLIGKGGMGDVYKARHRKMERTVALKVINRGLVQKAEAVDRFHREVKAAAQLSHSNIVTAYDADQAGDFHFMVMEYVDGVDLSQKVKDRGALPIAEACDYIRQAAIGLQHAHKCGMVHRDIKPHNLMVTSDGTVKILDFGLASLAPEAIADADTVEARGDLTAAGAIMGTPDFISAEQADDARKADIRSDIYSLGATLYFLLAGRPPFAEGSVTQKLKSHAQAEPEPLKTLREDIPPELAAVVTKMTAKDPEARFQTPAEVAEALKSFSRSIEPRKGVEPPTQAKSRRWKPRFLTLTAVAALFVALLAGAIFYLQTDQGVVRIEVNDPSLTVSIQSETITLTEGDKQPVTIRPGEQTLVVRKVDADLEFETDRFQIRRGDEIAFKVELIDGEIIVRKDGEKFDATTLPGDLDLAPQVFERMTKVYEKCNSYSDTGIIEAVMRDAPDAPNVIMDHSFKTAFVRPDRIRFEVENEDKENLLISANGNSIQTWWDYEPGIRTPASLDLAFVEALGFAGGNMAHVPALLLPDQLEFWEGGLKVVKPKRIYERKLDNKECYCLEFQFDNQRTELCIDKQSYLIRRIYQWIKTEDIYAEWRTTFNPTINGEVTEQMLDFDPPIKSVQPSFSYDLSQVPAETEEIYGYRPRQFREDGRFKRILESLDQSAPNKFLMDQNLEQVLYLQWANDDRTYSQPLVVLTVIDGTAMEFASSHLGVKIDGANSEVTQSKYFPIEQGKFFPMPAEQFVRFVDDKTMILCTRKFLDAHQIALKKQPNTELLKIAASMPDALLWVIGNTTDKDYVEQIKFRYSQSPLAAVLMTQLPIWEDTNYLTLSLVVGEDPNLQLAAHAPAAELQNEITQTVRTLPVTLANMLRPFSNGSGPADAKTIDELISALGEAQVTEPSGTESRLTISLKAAEPHLLRLLNSWFVDLEQAKSAAYKAASVSNLRQIGVAMTLFDDEYGYLPSVTTNLPGAKHPVSWRVAILKYLDEELYKQYNLDEPWDSKHNKKLLDNLPDFYRHPGQERGLSETCYVTLVGENTASGDGRQAVRMRTDITDNPAQTVLVTEAYTRIPWTKPEDSRLTDDEPLPKRRPQLAGWNVVFVDGSAQFISSETSADVLKALITRNGGEAIESEDGVWKKEGRRNQ